MTIELVTGTPGAGKTCYAVAKRIVPEDGREVEVEDDLGQKSKTLRRVVVAGIRGLSVPHERLPHTLTGERVTLADIEKWNALDADGEPRFKRLPGEPALEVEATLFNWWLWCRPGDLIVCDEVQFIIPRGTLGKTPPHYIKSLEIHRHYGVDFLFITQSPTLLDSTIRNLVGLHRHIRAVYGGLAGLCMVYEWDHASNTERYTNATKAFYRRRPEYFKLYKSTVAVVAPPKSGRGFLWMLPLAFVATAAFAWQATGSLRGAKGAPTVSAAASSVIAASARAGGQPFNLVPGWVDVPKLSGCYTVGEKCSCQDTTGRPVSIAPAMCRTSAASFDGLVRWEPRQAPASAVPYGAAVRSASAPS